MSLPRRARTCLLCALALLEPCLHALGLPHPEGLAGQMMNLLSTVGVDDE